MRQEVVEQLLAINREFYQSFASEFAGSRGRLQPGVARILKRLPKTGRILDLGCAHGTLATGLHRTDFEGRYVGLDASPALLEKVPAELAPPTYTFLQVDFTDADWAGRARSQGGSELPHAFDDATAFATLHHLPSSDLRQRTLTELRPHLAETGRVHVSVWNFLASERLKRRIRPWAEVGLKDSDVEPDDYLMDWRRGGEALRYVHHFGPGELADLADQTGYRVRDQFYSDGEGGRLGLYQTWTVTR